MPLAAILALAPQAIEAGKTLYQFLHDIRQVAQRDGEWTEAEEKAFEECLQSAARRAEWQVRKPVA